MYNKRYGYSKTVTLQAYRRAVGSREYNALCMVTSRISKELFGSHPKHNEYIGLTSSRERTLVELSYYPLLDHINIERQAAKLYAKYMKELQPYIGR